MSYCGYITRIKSIRKHENADRLMIAEVFNNSVIVGLDMKEGDLVVYFPSDGQLGLEFATKNNLLRIKGSNSGGYLDPEKRNIRAIRLRGEKSDGIIMKLDALKDYCDINTLKEGDQITTLGGTLICQKFVPIQKKVQVQGQIKKKVKEKESYPFFAQHSDTSQLAYNLNDFKEGDLCYITLKLHGTSQRFSHTIKQEDRMLPSFLQKALKKINVNLKPKSDYEYVSGTRRVILKNFNGGYYGDNQFRKKWHDFFVDKAPKGMTIYFEVVGYSDNDKLIMPSCNNKLLQDKNFIKKYGGTTEFTYGCEEGESDIYVYRMTMTNEDGFVTEIPWESVKIYCEQMGVKHVPELDKFFFTTQEDLMERVTKYEVGEDPIGKTHIREGVIVRNESREKFTALKQKSFEFRVLEGIIKDSGVSDMEEVESVGGDS